MRPGPWPATRSFVRASPNHIRAKKYAERSRPGLARAPAAPRRPAATGTTERPDARHAAPRPVDPIEDRGDLQDLRPRLQKIVIENLHRIARIEHLYRPSVAFLRPSHHGKTRRDMQTFAETSGMDRWHASPAGCRLFELPGATHREASWAHHIRIPWFAALEFVMVNVPNVGPDSTNKVPSKRAFFNEPLRRLAMRSLGVRLPILAATAWAGIGLSVLGSGLRLQRDCIRYAHSGNIRVGPLLMSPLALTCAHSVQFSQVSTGRLH